MTDTLGDRIRARRAARVEQHTQEVKAHTEVIIDELRAYIDDQVAAVHARIDKLTPPKRTSRK